MNYEFTTGTMLVEEQGIKARSDVWIPTKKKKEANRKEDQSWRLNGDLGKVRPEKVKKIAKELLKRFPDKFTADFESNKKALESLSTPTTAKLRNRIAGYVTRLVAIANATEKAEAEETEETAEAEED